MTPRKSPPAVHSGPADHVVGDAAAQSPGTGTDTAPSSGWLDGMIGTPAAPGATATPANPAAPPAAPQGVPISTRPRGDRSRGKAIESKRGQQ